MRCVSCCVVSRFCQAAGRSGTANCRVRGIDDDGGIAIDADDVSVMIPIVEATVTVATATKGDSNFCELLLSGTATEKQQKPLPSPSPSSDKNRARLDQTGPFDDGDDEDGDRFLCTKDLKASLFKHLLK